MASQIIISLLLSSFALSLVSAEPPYEPIKPPPLDKLGKERLSNIRLYWQEVVVGGPNPTAVTMIPPASNTSRTKFGKIRIFGNALTAWPERNSELYAGAQGFHASASQQELIYLMAQSIVFVAGPYNGSSIIVLGGNPVFHKVRETPVIGGTGAFRVARGYVEAKIHKYDPATDDVTVEYNIYVLHYN